MQKEKRECPHCKAEVPVLPDGRLMSHTVPWDRIGSYSCRAGEVKYIGSDWR